MSETNKSIQLLRSEEVYSTLDEAKASLENLTGERKDGEVLAARYKDDDGKVRTVLGAYHDTDGDAGVTIVGGGAETDLTGYLTEETAAATYQPIGDYASSETVTALESEVAGKADTFDVEAEGTSPLNLSAEIKDGKLVLTGSVDGATGSTAGVVKPVSVLSESVEINDASAVEARYYPVQTTPDNRMVVNVPWIDYSEGTSDGSGLMTAEEKEMLQKIYDYLKEQMEGGGSGGGENGEGNEGDDNNGGNGEGGGDDNNGDDDNSTSGAIGNATVMNVAFYDSEEDKVIAVESEDINTDDYPASRYTPIGIVVVPSSWDVYGDGTCGVLALSEMNYSTPDAGSNTTHQTMYWGQYNVDTSLTNYNTCVVTGTEASPTEEASGTASTAYLPSDAFSGTACPTDSSAHYYNTGTSNAAPSPYLDDGGLNPVYVQTTDPTTVYNCLSDFDGKGNTETLLELATSQSDWKTATTITDNSGSGYSPAACCCWRYSTKGTSQGDWYLPACGEMGCVIARRQAINDTISKLNSVYGTVGLELGSSNHYWSSSEYSSSYARYVNASNGYVGNHYKYNGTYVRAFARL